MSRAPNSFKRGSSRNMKIGRSTAVTAQTHMNDAVNIALPSRCIPLPRRLLISTQPPSPNRSAKANIIFHMGITTASAEAPSGPSYCPTIMQSTSEYIEVISALPIAANRYLKKTLFTLLFKRSIHKKTTGQNNRQTCRPIRSELSEKSTPCGYISNSNRAPR